MNRHGFLSSASSVSRRWQARGVPERSEAEVQLDRGRLEPQFRRQRTEMFPYVVTLAMGPTRVGPDQHELRRFAMFYHGLASSVGRVNNPPSQPPTQGWARLPRRSASDGSPGFYLIPPVGLRRVANAIRSLETIR